MRISTLRRGLPQIPIIVTNVVLKETERHGDYNDPKQGRRADVYFGGSITVNGKILPCEVHLLDKGGWEKGSWYVTMNANENKHWNKVPTKDILNALPEQDGYVGKAFAQAIFPILIEKGFKLAKYNWWLMDVNCDKQGEQIAGERTRQFYYKQRRQITCPVHGEFIQETEESSL